MASINSAKYLKKILKPNYLDFINGKMTVLGMSQSDIAKKLEIYPSDVSAVLKGNRFNFVLFNNILKAINLPLIDLIKDDAKEAWQYAIESTAGQPGVASVSKE